MKARGGSYTYLLSGGNKHLVVSSAMLDWISKFGSTATVSTNYLSNYPSGNVITSLIKSDTKAYFINGGHKFVVNATQTAAMGLDMNSAVLVSNTQLATLPSPMLIKSSASPTTYLVDDYLTKHPLNEADLSSYSGLGSTGVVPEAYLASITTKTDPARMVNGSDGISYLLVGSKKYRILNVATAKAISPDTFGSGANFSVLPTLSATQLAKYPLGNSTAYVTTYVKTTGASYLIENGMRREILDSASLMALLASTPAVSAVSAQYFKSLPLGVPVISDNNIFKTSDANSYGLFISGVYYPVPTELHSDIKSSPAWRFNKSSGTLTSASIAKLTQGVKLSNFVNGANGGFLLTAQGKQPLTDIQNIASAVTMPNVVLDKIDTSSNVALSTPILVKDSESAAKNFLVVGQKSRPVVDNTETTKLLPLAAAGVAQIWPKYVISQLAAGPKAFSPATLVKVRESGNIYLIDGFSRALKISAATALGFKSKMKTVARSDLTGYNTATALDWRKVACGGNTYLMDQGTPLLLDAETASQWPKTAVTLDSSTCQKLQPTTKRVGLFVANGTAKFKVFAGKLRPIRTDAEYSAMLGNQTPAAPVSAELLSALPKLNPTSYVVVSRDTLTKVAVKFKTTRAVLRTLNNLTTDRLKRGQVLILP
jgi:LysM repeat protein